MSQEVLQEETGLNQDQIKKIYKDLVHYKQSDNFKQIVEDGKKEGEKLLAKIQEELAKRKTIKMEYSEVNKLNLYINFYSGIKEAIDDSDGGKKFKEELEKQIQNAYSHIYQKVEVGFDTPMFTKMDFLKVLRSANLTLDKKLEEIINEYMPKAEDKETLHPYEE